MSKTMTVHILNEALRISSERPGTHGTAEDHFTHTAALWSSYLNAHITGADVCQMMALLKMSRAKTGNANVLDHYVDQTGYSALAGRMAIQNLPNLADLEASVKMVAMENLDQITLTVVGKEENDAVRKAV
jgi:hypothetical protein